MGGPGANTDHTKRNNFIYDWEGVNVIDRESNTSVNRIRKSSNGDGSRRRDTDSVTYEAAYLTYKLASIRITKPSQNSVPEEGKQLLFERF